MQMEMPAPVRMAEMGAERKCPSCNIRSCGELGGLRIANDGREFSLATGGGTQTRQGVLRNQAFCAEPAAYGDGCSRRATPWPGQEAWATGVQTPSLLLFGTLEVEGDVDLVTDLILAGVHAKLTSFRISPPVKPMRIMPLGNSMVLPPRSTNAIGFFVPCMVSSPIHLIASIDRLDDRTLECQQRKLLVVLKKSGLRRCIIALGVIGVDASRPELVSANANAPDSSLSRRKAARNLIEAAVKHS